MDWTDFDHDDQATLALHLVTGHGRAAPAAVADRLEGRTEGSPQRFRGCVPAAAGRTRTRTAAVSPSSPIAASAIRSCSPFSRSLALATSSAFRGNIHVTDADGTTKPAAEWVGKGGRARKLTDARVTAKGQQVGAVVCVHAKDMKEPWCLATSERDATAATLINHYAKRWTIEPQFRDTKDLRFGMGLSSTRIGEPMRRDRLLLVSAFATALLTLLGAVGESLGMDRLLKSNTSKTRTHSLFRQGCMLYELIPNMPEHRLTPLMEKFAEAVSRTGLFPTAIVASK